jgi:hypothetical protein
MGRCILICGGLSACPSYAFYALQRCAFQRGYYRAAVLYKHKQMKDSVARYPQCLLLPSACPLLYAATAGRLPVSAAAGSVSPLLLPTPSPLLLLAPPAAAAAAACSCPTAAAAPPPHFSHLGVLLEQALPEGLGGVGSEHQLNSLVAQGLRDRQRDRTGDRAGHTQ